jgi:hypothetical protein
MADRDLNPEMFGYCKKCNAAIEYKYGCWRDQMDQTNCPDGGIHTKK